MPPNPEMYAELIHLRGRRGIDRPDLGEAVGPQIRMLAGIGASDSRGLTKQRVVNLLQQLIEPLPPDLQQAARFAFALHHDHRYPTLAERTETLARTLICSTRTVRRLMDRAAEMMADSAADSETAGSEPAGSETADRARGGPGWRVASLRSLFRLDTPTPELYEMRRIVATQDTDRMTVRLGLPQPSGDGASSEPIVDVLFGARVAGIERQEEDFLVVLDLSRTVPADGEHELWLRIVVPPTQRIWSHYAIVPLSPCDSGTVRVRFAPDRLPSAIWLLDEVPYLDLRDGAPGCDRIEADRSGDVVREFNGMREGHGYGIAWDRLP